MKNVEEPGSSINELGSLFSIQTANISKSFSGTTVLDDINLELKSGANVTIICYDWSKEMGFIDHLSVGIESKLFSEWLNN